MKSTTVYKIICRAVSKYCNNQQKMGPDENMEYPIGRPIGILNGLPLFIMQTQLHR